MEKEQNTYSEVEILIGSFFALGIDAAAFIIDWTGVGLALAPFLQSGAIYILSMWSMAKGDTASLSVGRQIVKHFSQWVPLLPTVLCVFLIETYIHNHPTTSALASKISAAKGLKAPVPKA